jgi:hypothetical protein
MKDKHTHLRVFAWDKLEIQELAAKAGKPASNFVADLIEAYKKVNAEAFTRGID